MLYCETFRLLCHLDKQTVQQLGEHIQGVCHIYIVQQSLCSSTSKCEAPQNATSKANPSVLQATKDSLLLLEHNSLPQLRALNSMISVCRESEKESNSRGCAAPPSGASCQKVAIHSLV